MPTNQNAALNQRQINVKEPVLLQGDFRKVSGISSEIFRQIEAVENDHDSSTAAALEVSQCAAFPCVLHAFLQMRIKCDQLKFSGGGKTR